MIERAELPATRLRNYFAEMQESGRIGGSSILEELSRLASACIDGATNAQDVVAFVLSDVFWQHARDRDERPVTLNETYELMALGNETLTEAINFIEAGGTSDEATRIAAALMRLTPGRLHIR